MGSSDFSHVFREKLFNSNLGYISETAACVLDRQLQSYIVPHTKLLNYDHQRFYSYWDKSNDVTKLPKRKDHSNYFKRIY